MADIEKLAGVWLNQQSKLWPELVALGVLPEKSPDVIRQLAESFEQDFLQKEASHYEPPQHCDDFETVGVAYVRFSSAMQNPRSLDDQLHQILDRAKQMKVFIPWQLVMGDSAQSGTLASRTGYRMAREALLGERQTGVSTLFVDAIDRASRDGLEILTLGKTISDEGKRLIGVSNGFDSHNPQSRSMLYMYAAFNEEFMAQHREKVMRGRRGALRRGIVVRPLPLGLKRVPIADENGNHIMNKKGKPSMTAVPDPEWAWAVEWLAELYVDKKWSLRQITQEFNANRIGNRNNWGEGTVSQMLRNRRYIGVFIEGMKRNVKDPKTGKQKLIDQPREKWTVQRIRGAQIWSYRRWKQVQAQLLQNSNLRFDKGHSPTKHRVDTYPTRLLAGVLFCGSCGRPLRLARSGKTTYSMQCNHGRRKGNNCTLRSSKSSGLLEPAILHHVKTRLLTEDNLRALVEKANAYIEQESARPAVDVAPLQADLDRSRRGRDNLMAALEEADVSDATSVLNRIRKLEVQMKEIKKRISEADQLNQERIEPIAVDGVLSLLDDLKGLMDSDVQTGNEALKLLLGPVPVYQQENSAARRPIWIARIKGDLVPLIADMAQRRQLPDASNLRKLNGRSWKFVLEMDLNLELKVPLYEVIAPDVDRLMKQNLMNKQIAKELNVCIHI